MRRGEANRRRRVVVTPEGLALPLTLASRGARLGALLLDLGMLVGTQLVVALTLLFTGISLAGHAKGGAGSAANGDSMAVVQFLVILWLVGNFLLVNGWFLYFELRPRGATPGKRLVGIRIAARDGGRLSAEAVIARNLLRAIELSVPFSLYAAFAGDQRWLGAVAAAAWLLAFNAMPFWNRDRLRAGDIVGGTWVVEAPRRKLLPALSAERQYEAAAFTAPQPAYRFSAEELAIYGEFELQTLERVLRDDRVEATVAVATAICAKIGWSPPGDAAARAFLTDFYTQLRARLEAGMRLGTRKADKHSAAGAETGGEAIS